MNTDTKKKDNKEQTIPTIVCSVYTKDGDYNKVEISNFSGGHLTKGAFHTMINWLEKEKEKYPDTFK